MNTIEEKLNELRKKWTTEKDPSMKKVIEIQAKLLKKALAKGQKERI